MIKTVKFKAATASLQRERIKTVNSHSPVITADRMLRTSPMPAVRQPVQVRTVTSDSLFLGMHEIGIEHRGSLYRLKITRQGKLILNK